MMHSQKNIKFLYCVSEHGSSQRNVPADAGVLSDTAAMFRGTIKRDICTETSISIFCFPGNT